MNRDLSLSVGYEGMIAMDNVKLMVGEGTEMAI